MKQRRRIVLTSMILCMSMVCSQLSIVKAEEEIKCNHVHNEECGVEDNEGNYPECPHVHDVDCAKEIDFEEETINHEEIAKSIQILEFVAATVVQNELVIDFTGNMNDDINTAESNIQDKSKITTIKVTGENVTSFESLDDWLVLIELFEENSSYSNVTTLDLSEMSKLKTIGNYETLAGITIEPIKLKEIKLPDSLTMIGRHAFDLCSNLKKINLPNGLEEVGDFAFLGCESLVLDKLPDSIISIGNDAFFYCKTITLKKLPNDLTTLGNEAFANCTQLAITMLPKGLTDIGFQTFMNTGIKEIVIHDGITNIEAYAFSYCTSLSKITFMGDIPTIADDAFNEILNEVEIIYPVNAKNTENLDGKFDNWKVKYILLINFNESSKNKMSDAISTALGGQEPSVIVSVKVTGDATSIKDTDWFALIRIFNSYDTGNKYPKNLTLDLSEMSNLQTIGDYIDPTKRIYDLLKEVKLPNSLKTIERYTFSDCTNLTTIYFPDELEKIDEYAFFGCESLELYKLPDNIKEIGNNAFYECKNISLTKLPDSLTTLGFTAFASCEQLAITELPKGIQVIDSQTFKGTGIEEIVIHENIKEIKDKAFANCLSLSKITFMGDIPTIANNAFTDISLIGQVHYTEGASGYERLSEILPAGWEIIMIKKPKPSGSSSSHSHYYGKQWKSDEENHWHECSCGKQKDLEAHEFDEWVVIDEEHRERECRICGFIQKETFTHRQLTDAVTGVQLSGTMSERAELVVSESPSHAAGLCNACDEIRSLMSEGKLIKAYEISIKGEYKGELTLSFPMDPKYNGESFMLYHYVEDGRADQLISVNNGKAEGKVQTLSPFAIVRSNEMITQQVSLNQGEQITIYPATMDGVWAYDDEMIQLTQNKDSYTITAIKEGSTSAIYTTKTTQTIVDVNILASHVPNTNDAMNRYILMSILSLCAILIIRFTKETTSA